MSDDPRFVGRVLRASTRGFDCGNHSRKIDAQHDFGNYVCAPIANSDAVFAVGLIYKVEVKDDQLISELVLGGELPNAILNDQRNNRIIPVEVKVLNVGYMAYVNGERRCVHSLPPRPPMSLADVLACTEDEIYDFTIAFDFFRIVLQASEVPSDDLIAAAIQRAAEIDPDPDGRYRFLVNCGRRLAQDLSHDVKRLKHILSLIHPSMEA